MNEETPINLELIFGTDEDIRGVPPIEAQDIMEGMTKNFHPRGLFSNEYFGKVGSEYRNRMFAYIDLHVDIIHPHLYRAVVKLKAFYGEILSGRAYAIFDPKLSDFVPSTILEGETGYQFFFDNYPKIKFEERESRARKKNIKLLYKYKDRYWINKLLVLPAGLRDYQVDETGKPSEDEINPLYRRVMAYAFSLESFKRGQNTEFLNPTRHNLQQAVLAVYEHLLNILKGKKGLIQQHWTTRAVMNSTRNVLVAYTPSIERIDDPRSVDVNKTVIGLYQFLRAYIPICVKEVRERFSANVFTTSSGTAGLINPKTLQREMVLIGSEHQEMWMTYDGLEKVFDSFKDLYIRHQPLVINGNYMALIYDDGKHVRLVFDPSEIPEGRDKKNLRPATLTEVLYLCVARLSFDAYGFVTRFPVAGYGGIYPSGMYLRTTVNSRVVLELQEDWTFNDETDLLSEFPIKDIGFFEAMSPSSTHLKAMGGDHDGDLASLTGVWAEESKQEIKDLLGDWSYYISASGRMNFSFSDDILDWCLLSMTSKD